MGTFNENTIGTAGMPPAERKILEDKLVAFEKKWATKPSDLPSGIPHGEHYAFYFYGGRLLFEVDIVGLGMLLQAIKGDASSLREVVLKMGAALGKFSANHPLLTSVGGSAVVAVGKAAFMLAKMSWKAGFGPSAIREILVMEFPTTMAALDLMAAIILIELVIIAVRTVEVAYIATHAKGFPEQQSYGGIIVTLIFPMVQVASEIMPRGGYTEDSFMYKLGAR
ncbi:MAG: hypothetical protein ACREPM_03555 [Gemmatimonadaceae bacterium]